MKAKNPLSSLKIPTFWTQGKKAQSLIPWRKTEALIKDARGGIHFQMPDVETPATWSPLATEIAASKYFRKKGVGRKGYETSVRQMVDRVVDAIVKAGIRQGCFKGKESQNFAEELKFILWTQKAAFNSPVWFNLGLSEAYGIKSPSDHWVWNGKKVVQVHEAYKNPQASACFIQKIDDSIEGIFELAKTEAKLFKYGSGTGTNFSTLRSRFEELGSGGTSSGLISFLDVLDRGAGAIKSGGTTRRAAKMVIVDIDHPEIEAFIDWKKNEEEKVHLLIQGGMSSEFEGAAYKTVSGQNANNSVRVTDQFMKAILANQDWELKARSTKKTLRRLPAAELWEKISVAAWACADPGLQFHDTINSWNTCAEDAEIRASNPCSEFMFLDDTACNLASLNLVNFFNSEGRFDLAGFLHTVRIVFIAQEILVDHASYPTAKIAQNSHDYRPLGIGFSNLGSLLMRLALPYDDDRSRGWAALLSALLTGQAYLVSTEMARKKGPFVRFKANKKSMLKVIKKHAQSMDQWRAHMNPELFFVAKNLWQEVLENGKKFGFRNSQASAIAPTGTIGLMMDCDTTGIEPEFSLIKTKKLVGGGHLEIVNTAVEPALLKLGYKIEEIKLIQKQILQGKNISSISELKPQHRSLFSCAVGDLPLSPESHLKMMAAVQPFVSGAISKTVNLPADTTPQGICQVYTEAWRLGLKSIAIYRDGSKKSQPLNQNKNKIPEGFQKCPECGGSTELHSGCYRCTNCGFSLGCA